MTQKVFFNAAPIVKTSRVSEHGRQIHAFESRKPKPIQEHEAHKRDALGLLHSVMADVMSLNDAVLLNKYQHKRR